MSDTSRLALYKAWVARTQQTGEELAPYHCPRCAEQLWTQIPPESDGAVRTWDSFTTCPHCNAAYFKTVSVVHDEVMVDIYHE